MDQQTVQQLESQTISTKKTKSLLPLLIILIILTVGSVGFGIYGILKPAVIKEVQKCEEQTPCETAQKCEEQTPCETKLTINFDPDYIYITEWGIKIKKPDINITFYTIGSTNTDADTFTIVGTPKNPQISLSDKLHIALTTRNWTTSVGLGGEVYRYPADTFECNQTCPTFITTIDSYDYYYLPQLGSHLDQTYSEADFEVEGEIAEIIKNTLNNPNSYSAI